MKSITKTELLKQYYDPILRPLEAEERILCINIMKALLSASASKITRKRAVEVAKLILDVAEKTADLVILKENQ